MDARTGPPAPPGRIAVRLSDLGELAAALPHLLGFRPAESVVLVGLVGPGARRLGMTARADIPPVEAGRAMARLLAAKVVTGRPAGVVAVVVSEAGDAEVGDAEDGDAEQGLPHRGLMGHLCAALAEHAVPVRDVLLVRGGRWWSYDCPERCCAPGVGTALPDGVTELEVAAVAAGVVVEPDRATLAARVAPPEGLDRSAMAAVCAQVALECAERILDGGWDTVTGESWAAVLEALARCRPGAVVRLTDREVARVVWGLRDRSVRDLALQLALGEDAPAAEQLWTECTRRAPVPLDAAAATLLAVSAWVRGDGATAGIALDRALAGEPGYALARLLSEALDACLSPDELRRLIRSAAAAGR
ncbi:DUF4192 domain-containing protein [Blastococcus haudaquaticus]|uniref:DUF4192 domain-containing protein n=1 Tax=Blastococcus haudaquaticus TaxID=1938745 RepID=A0A286GUR0_9ACTN|nr:DUF4192 domain-containing protein [Blastococcus haudaquaticus]SOD99268.1 protein of unknown function [Blastococcus haudaquaticus]